MSYLIVVSAPTAPGAREAEEVLARAIWQLPGVGFQPQAESRTYTASSGGGAHLLAALRARGPRLARARDALARVEAAGAAGGAGPRLHLIEEGGTPPEAALPALAEVAPHWPLARGTVAAALAAVPPARRAAPCLVLAADGGVRGAAG